MMKKTNLLIALLALAGMLLLTAPATQAQVCDSTGNNFVDLNGDGFNDNAPDADGDGIPNGLDPDYIKNAQDGEGYKMQKGKMNSGAEKGIAQAKTQNKFKTGNKFQKGNMYKFQKRVNQYAGTSGQGTGVCDGTGPQGGSGICDGTGPKGQQGRR